MPCSQNRDLKCNRICKLIASCVANIIYKLLAMYVLESIIAVHICVSKLYAYCAHI